MPFWSRAPRTNEAYIAMERKHDEEKRRRFLEQYEKEKRERQKEESVEGRSSRFKEKIATKARSTFTKENLASGAKSVGRGLKAAYEYEPSPETKRSIRKAAQGIRSEVSELGQLSPPRRRRSDYRSAYTDNYSGGQDIFDMSSIAGYASAFDPWQNPSILPRSTRKRGRRREQSPFEGWVDAFDPFSSHKRR